MKKTLFICWILLIISGATSQLSAQRNELGLFGGVSYYLGDINPRKHFSQTQYGFGLIYRYNINPHWAMRLNAFYGSVESSDAVVKFNQKRNLSFRSEITELALGLELNFFPYATGRKKMKASPFIFAGLSYFNFNPQANFEGRWYELQPLGTEGQGTTTYFDKKPYNLGGFAIPFGIGAKMSISKKVAIAIEWGLRKTFTDYLDDVSTTYADPLILQIENSEMSANLSDRTIWGLDEDPTINVGKQRGDSSTKDWYSFAGMTITFRINTQKVACHGMPQRTRKFKDFKYD